MINAGSPTDLDAALDFLGEGRYAVKLYRDGPSDTVVREESVHVRTDRLALHVPANGGAAYNAIPIPASRKISRRATRRSICQLSS